MLTTSVSDSTVTGTLTVTSVLPSDTVRSTAVTLVNDEPVIRNPSAGIVPAVASMTAGADGDSVIDSIWTVAMEGMSDGMVAEPWSEPSGEMNMLFVFL